MTLQDKTVKKYVKDIKKQLRVPFKMKSRIVSDLNADVNARLEEGETLDSIIVDMGTPKAVAHGFNSELEDSVVKGSPWRFVFLGLAILLGAWIILSIISMVIQPEMITAWGKGEQSGTAMFLRINRAPMWLSIPLMVACLMEYFLLKWGKSGTKNQYTIIIVGSVMMMLLFAVLDIWVHVKDYQEFERSFNVVKGNFKTEAVIGTLEMFLLPSFWLSFVTLIIAVRKRKSINVSEQK